MVEQNLRTGAGRREATVRWAWTYAMAALFCCLVLATGYLQGVKLALLPSLQLAIQSLVMVGIPLVSYHYHREIRQSGRPILAGLMHAVALFSGLMALAVADMGNPISQALSSKPDRPHSNGPTAAVDRDPTAASTGAGPSRRVQGQAPLPGPLTRRTPDASPANARPEPGNVAPTAPAYSLYDMLSLVGMIATITLIVFGALVPEESRMLERRRERRRRALESLNRYSIAITDFHQHQLTQTASEASALATWHAGNELEMLVEDPDAALGVAAIVSRLHELIGVQAVLARTWVPRDRRATPADLQAELRSLRALLEKAHPRQA